MGLTSAATTVAPTKGSAASTIRSARTTTRTSAVRLDLHRVLQTRDPTLWLVIPRPMPVGGSGRVAMHWSRHVLDVNAVPSHAYL
jgi:N-formylglutamate amidohydrolase